MESCVVGVFNCTLDVHHFCFQVKTKSLWEIGQKLHTAVNYLGCASLLNTNLTSDEFCNFTR